MTLAPTDTAVTDTVQPTAQSTRGAQVAFELLFSATTSFLLTSALLPLFGLHVSSLTVFRVTGICTLVVFATLDLLFGIFRRPSNPHREIVPNENPEFKLNPRGSRDVEAGWSREKPRITNTHNDNRIPSFTSRLSWALLLIPGFFGVPDIERRCKSCTTISPSHTHDRTRGTNSIHHEPKLAYRCVNAHRAFVDAGMPIYNVAVLAVTGESDFTGAITKGVNARVRE
ncbi:hypothetical protein B0H19DRAFT_1072547 [Mycena capillaripes]|nr:hypothetical protein B0H19DRAFT_1072547 [Mycena capillaripes]